MRNIRRVSLALAFAFSAVVASSARADAPGDAWGAAKSMLPANPYVVMGFNIATIKSSTLFQQLYPKLIAQSGEAKEGLDMVQADCGINVTEAIQGVVVAIDDSNAGIIVLSTKGLDQTKINDCFSKVAAKKEPGKKITAGKPDAAGVVEYTASGEKDAIFIAYLPKGVIVMATDPKDKSLLQKWMGGKGADAKGVAGTALGKVNTGAAMWGAVVKAEQIDAGLNMKAAYGAADIAGGNIAGDVHVVLGSAKEATEAAVKFNDQLEQTKKGGQVPPAFANILKSVKIAAVGDEVVVKASISEKEALGLAGMAMGH